jgi:hypothetical protein
MNIHAAVIIDVPTEFARIVVIRRSPGDQYDIVVNDKVTHRKAFAEDVIKVLGYYLRERRL